MVTTLLCSTQLPVHQRMNANGNRYQIIYFPETIIQWDTISVMVILYNCCTMHNNTHSVHNRLLKMWWARLPRPWPSQYVYPPPLSADNCPPFPSPGGPGPPASKMVSFSPGSTHTPSPPSITIIPEGYEEKASTNFLSCLYNERGKFSQSSCLLNELKIPRGTLEPSA